MLTATDIESTVFDVLEFQVVQYWKKIFTISCSKYIDDVITRCKPGERENPRESKLSLAG